MTKRKILLGLTTTPGSDWRAKTEEIDQLGLEEVAVFPTFLKLEERKELYALLEKTNLKKITHVHLRDDMEGWEVKYFLDRWKTQVFNIHPYPEFKRFLENRHWREIIFVENHSGIGRNFLEMSEICGGLCLDYAHWRVRQNKPWTGYWRLGKIAKEKSIGCCHISPTWKKMGIFWVDSHFFRKLSDFDYLKEYQDYFPEIISLELENSFAQQLEAKKYLEERLIHGA